MMTVSNITLHLPPPPTAEIGAAYVRLALGVAQHIPNLLHSYRGPADWLAEIRAEPPSLEALRQQAVDLATSLQQSHLPRQRRDWLLRQSRALLWLIRTQEKEPVIFSEQVRLLLDVPPESAEEAVFEMAHQALEATLPGSGALAERWAAWQALTTLPTAEALPLLRAALATLAELLGSDSPLLAAGLPTLDSDPARDTVGYQHRRFYLPGTGSLRVDRLYHLAAQAIAWHSLEATAGGPSAQPWQPDILPPSFPPARGEDWSTSPPLGPVLSKVEGGTEGGRNIILLNRGPEQIIRQGLPQAILAGVNVYPTALPALLSQAGLPRFAPDDLRAIHLAEDALAWAVGNTALLLHSEGLRPRALRRHLMARALLSPAEAEHQLEMLANPTDAAHLFASLIGGPLLTAWLARKRHSLVDLLTDPPTPATMLFEVRSDKRR